MPTELDYERECDNIDKHLKSKKCNHYPRIEGKKIICLKCGKIIGRIKK